MGGASSGRGRASAYASGPNRWRWTPGAGELAEVMGLGVEGAVFLNFLHHGDGGRGTSTSTSRELGDLRVYINLGHLIRL